jgi:hypothetical protein
MDHRHTLDAHVKPPVLFDKPFGKISKDEGLYAEKTEKTIVSAWSAESYATTSREESISSCEDNHETITVYALNKKLYGNPHEVAKISEEAKDKDDPINLVTTLPVPNKGTYSEGFWYFGCAELKADTQALLAPKMPRRNTSASDLTVLDLLPSLVHEERPVPQIRCLDGRASCPAAIQSDTTMALLSPKMPTRVTSIHDLTLVDSPPPSPPKMKRPIIGIHHRMGASCPSINFDPLPPLLHEEKPVPLIWCLDRRASCPAIQSDTTTALLPPKMPTRVTSTHDLTLVDSPPPSPPKMKRPIIGIRHRRGASCPSISNFAINFDTADVLPPKMPKRRTSAVGGLTELDAPVLLEQPMGANEGTQVNEDIRIPTFENSFRSSLVDSTEVTKESVKKEFLERIQESVRDLVPPEAWGPICNAAYETAVALSRKPQRGQEGTPGVAEKYISALDADDSSTVSDITGDFPCSAILMASDPTFPSSDDSSKVSDISDHWCFPPYDPPPRRSWTTPSEGTLKLPQRSRKCPPAALTVKEEEIQPILEMNPSASVGPSIGKGRKYDQQIPTQIPKSDNSESRYPKRPTMLSRESREVLLRDLGYSEENMTQAIETILEAKNQRKQTFCSLHSQTTEEMVIPKTMQNHRF